MVYKCVMCAIVYVIHYENSTMQHLFRLMVCVRVKILSIEDACILTRFAHDVRYTMACFTNLTMQKFSSNIQELKAFVSF